ncbi:MULTISPECIES: ATP-dependent DNA helicase [unclassified Acidovorax]|jgi:ATP-dependent DNA helicase DinG|uniref:ATP-dependent DNA helicase n=1 Tax=unclassified Acidovorax TaxID=2684926 RepID=UPI000B3F92FA|nr:MULTISPECIES: ATP-dependent DNA helicase [unclassified Acidovorax]
MSLVDAVHVAFGPDGVLSRMDAHYRVRDGQMAMADAVARTIERGGALVVEAGTGVGKTFAYLVPALLSGERVLLSTATKALQDQLFARDLPQLVSALALPVRTALLKGRGSYLCLHRMEQARQQVAPQDRVMQRVLAKVEVWSRSTRSGDLAELPGLDERSPAMALITSTRENCLGTACPRFRQCHVNLARREALAADVVVVNHHLFFADAAVRESGMAELLPTVRVVVFDEAHQINEIGVQFLGMQLTTGQLLDFSRDLLAAGLQHARGLADWNTLAGPIEQAAADLRMAVGPNAAGTKLRWTGEVPEAVAPQGWHEALGRVSMACAQALEALDPFSETSPDFVRLYERGSEILVRLGRFAAPCSPDAVRWVDVGGALRLVESPLDIAQAMRTRLLAAPTETAEWEGAGDEWPAPQPHAGRAWIFTSATLGDDAALTWFTERCGLQGAEILRVESPFDYASQAALYVPRHLPKPADPAHSIAVAQLAGAAAGRLGGRTLVLTTTLKALRTIGDALQARFNSPDGLEVLVQGDWPKRHLMERFREGALNGRRGCVLVASASFWEGFDVPGDALQLVIIDKLPFPPPGDPLVEARTHRIEAAGGRAFQMLAVPEAAVALKQGAGRLIRRESDRGILVVCDTRLVTMGYGKRLMRALPPMRMLESPEAFEAALDALTRISTTDSTWS